VKKLIAFDLDGTLALSKQALDEDMAYLLGRLTQVAMVDIISGGDWPQFEKQVVSRMPAAAALDNLIIQPTTGTKLYRYQNGAWDRIYADLFSAEESKQIRDALQAAVQQAGYAHEQTWGEQIEDRGSQITFSALGQQAPVPAKTAWDPDGSKKERLRAWAAERLPGLEVRSGGSTSIDVTASGIDKAYGMRKLMAELRVGMGDILFVGDRLDPQGNDHPVEAMGIRSVAVKNWQDTADYVEGWLES